jgi:hypothetical protein
VVDRAGHRRYVGLADKVHGLARELHSSTKRFNRHRPSCLSGQPADTEPRSERRSGARPNSSPAGVELRNAPRRRPPSQPGSLPGGSAHQARNRSGDIGLASSTLPVRSTACTWQTRFERSTPTRANRADSHPFMAHPFRCKLTSTRQTRSRLLVSSTRSSCVRAAPRHEPIEFLHYRIRRDFP